MFQSHDSWSEWIRRDVQENLNRASKASTNKLQDVVSGMIGKRIRRGDNDTETVVGTLILPGGKLVEITGRTDAGVTSVFRVSADYILQGA